MDTFWTDLVYTRKKIRDQLLRKDLWILIFEEFPKEKSRFMINYARESILVNRAYSRLFVVSLLNMFRQLARHCGKPPTETKPT